MIELLTSIFCSFAMAQDAAAPRSADAVEAPQLEDKISSPLDSPGMMGTDAFIYDPTGRRDPFKPFFKEVTSESVSTQAQSPTAQPKLGLLGYEVGEMKLVGVLWGTSDPKGLVKVPSGKVYVVRKKTKIGIHGGFVASIREGEVVVVENGEQGKKAIVHSMVLGKAGQKDW